MNDCHDYIVIGAGSAGCIVAGRLAAEGAGSVLLLEAGNRAEHNPETMSADGFIQAFSNENTMIDRLSVEQATSAGRRLYMGSGTGMGGSGAVNGMVYTRGDRNDFAQWPVGWHWDDVAPAFDRVEQALRVRSRGPVRFTETCINAAVQAGFCRKDDLNDGHLNGAIGYQLMNYENAHRRSSYMAFLHGVFHPGLTITTDAKVLRIRFDGQNNATAVEYRVAGEMHVATARREIILCAGALETPRLLLLSGVGPAAELQALGIQPVADSPAVGKNLQDHPNVCMFYRGKQKPDAFYPQVYGFDRVNAALPLDAAQPDTCYVFYSAPASIRQSMQRMLPAILLPPALYTRRRLHRAIRALVNAGFMVPFTRMFVSKLFGLVVILGKPFSRGSVRLASADPDEPAIIDPAYFSDARDMDTLTAGVMRARSVASSPALVRWGNLPLSAAARSADREVIREWIKGAVMTTFHYCGTCRMGGDSDAPVDLQLRVRGVNRLRVADASVFPEIPVAALNAPTMMTAWRAVDFLLQDARA